MKDITCLAELHERRERDVAALTAPVAQPKIRLRMDSEAAFPAPIKTDDSFIYPWEDMQVGEGSFFVPGKPIQAVSRRVQKRQKASGHRYSCRAMDGGVRVWRMA